ncbi:MAG: hypothetical protein RLZZ293_1112 [Pseudomonadota bacterium]|jgi:hypothetical protein
MIKLDQLEVKIVVHDFQYPVQFLICDVYIDAAPDEIIGYDENQNPILHDNTQVPRVSGTLKLKFENSFNDEENTYRIAQDMCVIVENDEKSLGAALFNLFQCSDIDDTVINNFNYMVGEPYNKDQIEEIKIKFSDKFIEMLILLGEKIKNL